MLKIKSDFISEAIHKTFPIYFPKFGQYCSQKDRIIKSFRLSLQFNYASEFL